MRRSLDAPPFFYTALFLVTLVLYASSATYAQDVAPSVTERLVGRECLVLSYVGSYRSPLGTPIDRRPITTIVEEGSLRYVEASRVQLVLEGGTARSAEELTQLDGMLDGRPDLQGFYPGEVAVITSIKRREGKVEIEVADEEAGNDRQRRGRIVLRFAGGLPADEQVLEQTCSLLLPKPPYRDADEELRVILAALHRMELSRMAEWIGRSREETVHLAAEASLELHGLSNELRSALLECYEQSYLSLSDRSRIALVHLAFRPGTAGSVLEARAWPHLPLLGDWASEAQRARDAFVWSTTKVVRSLARYCQDTGVETLEVEIRYDYRGARGWGTDRLTSSVPAEVARAYAAIEIGAREMAGRSEHRLNHLPLSLGGW